MSPPGSSSIQLGCAPRGSSGHRPPHPASALLPPGLGLSCPRDLVLFLLARLCLATESVQHTFSRSPPRFPSDSESLCTRSTRTRHPRFSQDGRREALAGAEQGGAGWSSVVSAVLAWSLSAAAGLEDTLACTHSADRLRWGQGWAQTVNSLCPQVRLGC